MTGERSEVSKLMDGLKAGTSGDALIVKLPLTQILMIFGAAGMILAGVWLTTRDLGFEVRMLSSNVKRNTTAVEKMVDAVEDTDRRSRRNETRLDTLDK